MHKLLFKSRPSLWDPDSHIFFYLFWLQLLDSSKAACLITNLCPSSPVFAQILSSLVFSFLQTLPLSIHLGKPWSQKLALTSPSPPLPSSHSDQYSLKIAYSQALLQLFSNLDSITTCWGNLPLPPSFPSYQFGSQADILLFILCTFTLQQLQW